VTVDPGQIEVGARLKAAILRARVARGQKPTVEAVGRIGGADVRIGVSGGKPAVSVSREWRF
jgi:hypothetical protein